MPGMNGLEFVQALHEAAPNQHPNIVMCSGCGGLSHLKKVFSQSDIDAYLQKPVRIRDIEGALH